MRLVPSLQAAASSIAVLIASIVISPPAVAQTWVADGSTDSVVRLSEDGTILASASLTGDALGLSAAPDGSVWVSIPTQSTLVHVSTSGQILDQIPMTSPVQGIAIDAADNVWAVQPTEDRVMRIEPNGTQTPFATGDVPYGVAVDAQGRIWVTDSYGNSLTRIEPATATTMTTPIGFFPTGIAAHPNGTIWVAEKDGVRVLDGDAVELGYHVHGLAPRGVAVAIDGTVWVTKIISHDVTQYAADGAFIQTIPVGELPGGIAAHGDGSLSVFCRVAAEIWRLDADGGVLPAIAMGYPNGFGDPTGLQLALVVEPSADHDGDGAVNGIEGIHRTDPMDPAQHPNEFVRGDATNDATVDLLDVIATLRVAVGLDIGCPNGADLDDDTQITLVDAIGIASYLFASGPAPSEPFPAPGYDPTPSPCP